MKICLEETVPVEMAGRTIQSTVVISFEGDRDTDLGEVMRRVARLLVDAYGQRSAAKPPVSITAQPNSRPTFTWTQPELHAKAMKSVHRVVRAISDAGGNGLNVQEICQKARISTVPAYKMLKRDHEQGQYAARYLRASKVGRTHIVDLTPDGRQLASLIRAGRVPA